MFFIFEEAKETILDFSQGTLKVLQICLALIQYQCKMAEYNTLNVKLSNSQLNKLKSRIKNGTQASLNLPSNVIGHSNDEINFPHKLSLTNTRVSRLRKAFVNNLSANIKSSKSQLSKIVQSVRFLGSLLESLLKTEMLLMKNVLKPLAKSFLVPLRLTVPALATDAAIHKRIFGSGITTLIISNEEMKDVMKIVKSLKDSCLLIKGFSKTIKNGAKEQKGRFLSM